MILKDKNGTSLNLGVVVVYKGKLWEIGQCAPGEVRIYLAADRNVNKWVKMEKVVRH